MTTSSVTVVRRAVRVVHPAAGDAAAAIAAAIAAHIAAADPHPGYPTEAEVLAAILSLTAGLQPLAGNLTAISNLTALSADVLALLDDASFSAMRTSLGLGAVALLSRAARHVSIFNAAATAWTNQPAATTEVFGVSARRIYADLTGCTQVRLVAYNSVAGATNAKLGAQYSLDAGGTWAYLDGTADGDLGSAAPQVAIGSTGPKVSAYATLAAAARAPVLLRIVGDDGDGAADPQFTFLGIEAY